MPAPARGRRQGALGRRDHRRRPPSPPANHAMAAPHPAFVSTLRMAHAMEANAVAQANTALASLGVVGWQLGMRPVSKRQRLQREASPQQGGRGAPDL